MSPEAPPTKSSESSSEHAAVKIAMAASAQAGISRTIKLLFFMFLISFTSF
jgi:hypothetical protein